MYGLRQKLFLSLFFLIKVFEFESYLIIYHGNLLNKALFNHILVESFRISQNLI